MVLNKKQERLAKSVEGAVFRWIKQNQTRLSQSGSRIPISYDPERLLELGGAKFDRHQYAGGVTLVAAFATTYNRDVPVVVWTQVALSRHNSTAGARKPHEPNGLLDKLELSASHNLEGKPPYIDLCFDLRDEGINARTVKRDLRAAGSLVSRIGRYWTSDGDGKSHSKSGKELAATLQGARGRLNEVKITSANGNTSCIYTISPHSHLEIVAPEDPLTNDANKKLIMEGGILVYDLRKAMWAGSESQFWRA